MKHKKDDTWTAEDDIEVTFVSNLPLVDFQIIKAKLAPPGKWASSRLAKRKWAEISEALESARPHDGFEYIEAISIDGAQIALLRVRGRQERLFPEPLGGAPGENLSSAIEEPKGGEKGIASMRRGHDSSQPDSGGNIAGVDDPSAKVPQKDEQKLDSERTQTRTDQALQIVELIRNRYRNDDLPNAEDLLDILVKSPDRMLTINALGKSGTAPIVIAGPASTTTVGGGDPFPEELVSRTHYTMQLESFSNLNSGQVTALGTLVGFNYPDFISVNFMGQKRYTVLTSGSAQQELFEVAALFQCIVQVRVTVFYDTIKDRVEKLNLVSVEATSPIPPKVEDAFAQLKLIPTISSA